MKEQMEHSSAIAVERISAIVSALTRYDFFPLWFQRSKKLTNEKLLIKPLVALAWRK